MQEQGKVLAIEDGRARVAMVPGGHCQGCNLCSRMGANMEIDAQLNEEMEVQVGDRVLLDIPAELSYGAIVLVYVVPLAGLLLGGAVGSFVSRAFWPEGAYADLIPIVMSLLGLVVGFWFMSRQERRRRSARGPIRIIQVL